MVSRFQHSNPNSRNIEHSGRVIAEFKRLVKAKLGEREYLDLIAQAENAASKPIGMNVGGE